MRILGFLFLSAIAADKIQWGWNLARGLEWVAGPGIPQQRGYTAASPQSPSQCSNGAGGGEGGFACPHMMMLSSDMIAAADHDGLGGMFYYAVAGGASDDQCGMCFQVAPKDAETQWNDTLAEAQMLVQVINSGFDVLTGQLDVFMGAGGFGYFTACNKDCASRYCEGGPCSSGMYDGSFDQWIQPEHADRNPCYSGGVKHLFDDFESLVERCRRLTGDTSELRDWALWESCVRTNMVGYHQNFVSSDSLRVRCPDGMIRATGLRRRDDDDGHPDPHPDNAMDIHCRGDRSQGHYCITTMQDCCKPSCSWSDKGGSNEWPRADTCDKNGHLIL